jgi:hypothetical protein
MNHKLRRYSFATKRRYISPLSSSAVRRRMNNVHHFEGSVPGPSVSREGLWYANVGDLLQRVVASCTLRAYVRFLAVKRSYQVHGNNGVMCWGRWRDIKHEGSRQTVASRADPASARHNSNMTRLRTSTSPNTHSQRIIDVIIKNRKTVSATALHS